MKNTKEAQQARELGYEMVNLMQDKRRLYRFANMLINEIVENDPRIIRKMATMLMKHERIVVK